MVHLTPCALISFVVVILQCHNSQVHSATNGNHEFDWSLQICLSGKSYNISRSECSDNHSESHGSSVGIWFPEPTTIDRACFNAGIWAVYKEWCESNPTIWAGGTSRQNSCMQKNLLKNVLGFVYLGNRTGGVVISSSKQKLFFGSLETSRERWNLLNVELNVISWGQKTCYTLRQENTAHQKRDSFLMGGTSFFKEYRLNASYTENVCLSLHPTNCSKTVELREVVQKLLPVPQSRSDLKISYAFMSTYSKNKDMLDCNDFQNSRPNCELSRSVLDTTRDVNEQSARVALRFQGHIFHHLPLPEINLREWKLFEMSKTVFEAICPHQMVPKFFFDNIIILLKYLLIDSATKYPRAAVVDDLTCSRIRNALQRCIVSAKELTFTPSNACTQDDGIQVAYLNGTTAFTSLHLPEDLRNNVNAYDLIIEASWKLILFAHYACAKYFHQFSSDLSIFYTMWQELVTLELQERWTNPGKSLEMMKLIFKSIDLSRTVKNLDECVRVAHSQSVYTGWMKRPFQVKESRARVVTKDVIWDGTAYCMDTFAYPALRLGYPIQKCGVDFQS